MIIPLKSPELLTLLELDPFRFRSADRQSPGAGSVQADWRRYWFDSLADAGIVGIEPIFDSWFVPASALVDPRNLACLAKASIESCEAWVGDPSPGGTRPVEPEHLGPLDGGFCLRASGEFWVLPGCCSDFGNLASWEAASAYRGETWEMVWVGHPWISVRFSEGLLIFSKPHESNSPEARFSIDPGALDLAVDSANVELEQFEKRLLPIVEGLVPQTQARDVVRILVRGHGAFGR